MKTLSPKEESHLQIPTDAKYIGILSFDFWYNCFKSKSSNSNLRWIGFYTHTAENQNFVSVSCLC